MITERMQELAGVSLNEGKKPIGQWKEKEVERFLNKNYKTIEKQMEYWDAYPAPDKIEILYLDKHDDNDITVTIYNAVEEEVVLSLTQDDSGKISIEIIDY